MNTKANTAFQKPAWDRTLNRFGKCFATTVLAAAVVAAALTQIHAAPGDVDLSFDPGSLVNGILVNGIAVQSNGKVLTAGWFNAVPGAMRGGMARLNADGTQDTSFLISQNPAVYPVRCMALQSDGRILIGGYSIPAVARLNVNGSQDTSFAASVVRGTMDWPYLNCLALQPDGKILIGGEFTSVNGVAHTNVARLNPDGSLDNTFLNGRAGPNDMLWSVALQSDGKVLVGSRFTAINGVAQGRIARLNADGSFDSTFTNVIGVAGACVYSIALQGNGKILIGGNFEFINGEARNCVARLNADGSLDTSFWAGNGGNYVYCVAVQDDGRILIGGNFFLSTVPPRSALARLNADGSVDDSFAVNLDMGAGIESIAFQNDGRITIGGGFTAVNATSRTNVARLMGNYAAPSIVLPPQSQTAERAAGACLTLLSAGSPQLGYCWFFNYTNLISCSTNCELALPSVQFSQSGAYSVVVSNMLGAVTSPPAILNVIAPVERRPVPSVKVTGEAGSLLNVDYADSLSLAPTWTLLESVSLTSTSQNCFDLTLPLPSQRYYRAWQTGAPGVMPSVDLHIVPAITLTGNIGDSLRVDSINRFGPTDAWVTLDTVTLTNTSQLYFDVSAPGQPQRLYRLVPLP